MVAVEPTNGRRSASPAAPRLVDVKAGSVPDAWMALPVHSMMPLSMAIGVETEVNVPLACVLQLSVSLIMVMPGPDNLLANRAAVPEGVTVSCALVGKAANRTTEKYRHNKLDLTGSCRDIILINTGFHAQSTANIINKL